MQYMSSNSFHNLPAHVEQLFIENDPCGKGNSGEEADTGRGSVRQQEGKNGRRGSGGADEHQAGHAKPADQDRKAYLAKGEVQEPWAGGIEGKGVAPRQFPMREDPVAGGQIEKPIPSNGGVMEGVSEQGEDVKKIQDSRFQI